MKIKVLLLFTICISNLYSQVKESSLLILTPYELIYMDDLKTEIAKYNQNLKSYSTKNQEEYINSEEFKNKPKNVQAIIESEYKYSKKLNLLKSVSFSSEQYLAYVLYRKIDDLQIELSEQKSINNVDSLKKIATHSNIQYILNFSKVEFFKENNENFCKLYVQLYDNKKNKLVIDQNYIGDWYNNGFEFTCNEKTIDCTINNAIAKLTRSVIKEIVMNNNTVTNTMTIYEQQMEILKSLKLNLDDQKYILNILNTFQFEAEENKITKYIINEDQSKFVVVYSYTKEFQKNDDEKNVNVIMNNPDFSNFPNNYGYVLSGIKYNDGWYFEKSNITYFDESNPTNAKDNFLKTLIKMNYFEKNTLKVNSEFWESNSFEAIKSSVKENIDKIESLRKKIEETKNISEKSYYQNEIDRFYKEDQENRDYIGMPKIIANKLILEKEKQFEKQAIEIKSYLLRNYFSKEKYLPEIENMYPYTKYGDSITLITNINNSIFLSPWVIQLKNNKMILQYYLIIPNETDYDVYKWTYFPKIQIKNKNYISDDVLESISKLTKWDFSYKFISDQNFWDNYILLKENDSFKYLKKM